ncbi:MAG: hypothetical protein WC850_06050 [Candidatus Gracilibacteria bacterium]
MKELLKLFLKHLSKEDKRRIFLSFFISSPGKMLIKGAILLLSSSIITSIILYFLNKYYGIDFNIQNISIYTIFSMIILGLFYEGLIFWLNIKYSIKIKNIENGWSEISLSTGKSIKQSLLLNGRDEEKQNLLNYINNNGKKIKISSDSLFESYAFVLASLLEKNDKEVLIIENKEELDYVINKLNEKVLIIGKSFTPDENSNIGKAINKGHTLIFPIGRNNYYSNYFDYEIQLNSMNRFDRISGLEEILGDKDIAEKVYRETKGYILPILRNKELVPNENLTPKWLGKIDKKVLTAFFLLSEWKEGQDNELIEIFTENKYDDFIKELIKLEKEDDSPIRKIRNIWQIISKSDLWIYVKDDLDTLTLRKFKEVSKVALSDIDPSFELPIDKRWYASVLGKIPNFSQRIKGGISDSLTLLSTLGYENQEIQSTLSEISNSVLTFDNDISKVVNSIGGNIENIAESTPKVFLDFIEDNIDKLSGVFEQTDSFLSGGGAYPHLLWALERLSWNQDLIRQVTNILIKLTNKYDSTIRENHSNRPMGTLSEIYILWRNNTSLKIEDRIEILKSESDKYPDIIFQLITKLLNQTISSNIAEPNYQNWSKGVMSMTNVEHREYLIKIIDLFITLFEVNVENFIVDIIDNLDKFSIEHFRKVIEILKNYDYSQFENQQKLIQVQNEIEDIIYRFKIYNNKPFLSVYPEGEQELLDLHILLTLSDIIVSNIGLFNNDRKVILSRLNEYNGEKGHWDEDKKIADTERIYKVKEIYSKKGFDGIVELIKKLDYVHLVSQSIIEANLINELGNNIFSLLENKEIPLQRFAINFIRQIDFINHDFVKSKINLINSIKNNQVIANFLLGLKLNSRTIKLLKSSNEEIQKIFWEGFKNINYLKFLNEEDYGEANYIIEQLNKYGLYNYSFEQIDFIIHDKKGEILNNELILDTLVKLVEFLNKGGMIQSLSYHLNNILLYLYQELEKGNIEKNKILGVEIQYVKAVDNPKILNEELANNPNLFVELVTYNYKVRKAEKKEEVTKEQEIKAGNAYEIIRKFTKIPGKDKSGIIDYNVLDDWVNKTLNLLKEVDRYEVGSQKIGELLINCPVGKDGVWPCEEVRDIFEKYENKDLEIGFGIGKRNSRGTFSKGIFEGGIQEKELSDGFKSNYEKLRIKWPRTAKILKNLSDDYLRDSKYEDENVELGI